MKKYDENIIVEALDTKEGKKVLRLFMRACFLQGLNKLMFPNNPMIFEEAEEMSLKIEKEVLPYS
jgi:hypothetical protein